MSKSKMLVTASTFPRWAGDTEPRFVLDYAKAMGKWYDVTVLAPAAIGALDREILEGVNVIRYHYFPIHKWETLCYPGAIVPRIKEKKVRLFLVPFLFVSLRKNLKRYCRQFDIVHAHWLIPQGIVQAGIKNVPYIVTGHGGDVTSLNKSIIKKLKIKCLMNARAIAAVSGALGEYINEMYPNDKTEIISMGCNTTAFDPTNRDSEYFGNNAGKSVLFVGRLAEKKGVTYLIEAFKKVSGATLYIVGGGPLEEELKAQASVEELRDKVVFLGPKSHDELPKIYASADVFCAPSVTASDGDKEGFGLVILEAMASGTVVVASRSGGIPDIISDGKNGFLVEERDTDGLAYAINKALSEDMSDIVSAGMQTADSYSYEKIAERYHQMIEKGKK